MNFDNEHVKVAVDQAMLDAGFKFRCGSPSHPNGRRGWLLYKTKAEAEAHRNCMNVERLNYENPFSYWDRNFWRQQPEPWVVEQLEGSA